MNILATIYRLVGIALFVQLLLGGLLTFNFIGPAVHIIVGFILFILAIAALVFAFITKPPNKRLMGMSLGLVVLMIIQIILGFATLGNGSQIIAFFHFVNALLIFGLVISASVVTSMVARMPGSGQGASKPREKKQAGN